MKKILVIGTGGLAREFTAWFSKDVQIIGYLSANQEEHLKFNLPGILYSGNITPSLVGTNLVAVAVSSSLIKAKVYKELSELGFEFPSFIHPSSIVSDIVQIEEGVIIAPNCVVSANVRINKLSYINFCCGIGHDAIIGNFVQINPGSQIGGFTTIGDSAIIGSGSTILQNLSIGNNAKVGSGSVVFSRVLDNSVVMGNPAKRMRIFE